MYQSQMQSHYGSYRTCKVSPLSLFPLNPLCHLLPTAPPFCLQSILTWSTEYFISSFGPPSPPLPIQLFSWNPSFVSLESEHFLKHIYTKSSCVAVWGRWTEERLPVCRLDIMFTQSYLVYKSFSHLYSSDEKVCSVFSWTENHCGWLKLTKGGCCCLSYFPLGNVKNTSL